METINNKLSFKEKVGYGLGDTASCLFWQTISWYLLFFYTDVFGLNAAAAGFMIMILRSADAIVDPIVGMFADRTETKYGKFRPYLLWFSVPLSFFVILTFSTPDFSSTGKLVYAYFTYGIMMLFYSIINIPYSAMLGVLSSDSVERTSLSSFKFIGAYLGGLIISSTLLPLTQYFGGESAAKGWQISMIIVSIVAIGLYFITFISTKERIKPMETQKTSVGKDWLDLLKNGPWMMLLIASLTMILFVASRMNITTYYFKYYIGTQPFKFLNINKELDFNALTSIFNTINMIFSVIGVILVPYVTKLIGKKKTFLALFIFAMIVTSSYYFLKPSDLLLIMVLQALFALTSGPLSPLIWAMYADTADYSEWKNNRRATGLVFSAAIMAQKFGWAFGTYFAGLLLSIFGFHANMEQSADVKELIRALMSTIPVVAGIISVVIVLFYKLDDKTMKKIGEDLEARRVEAKTE